jgi:sterol desaturase/sphingolipid hydroxylase (fatty acid hydroxylase superfamily)
VLQTASRVLPELPLFLMVAIVTHLVMSFAQTLMHLKLGHHPIGGKFFRNHINFHHTYYSKDHLLSQTYLGDEGNNTPFFFIPVFLVGACTYLFLLFDLFVVQAVACAASFYAHVFFDKEYHVEGSQLQRFAWFRRKQELHFVHHRHANSNFAVIHFFWDRILGTYRRPDAGHTHWTHSDDWIGGRDIAHGDRNPPASLMPAEGTNREYTEEPQLPQGTGSTARKSRDFQRQ